MEYLKSDKYYIDLYDLLTIKDCLRTIEIHREIYKSHFNDPTLNKLTDEEKTKDFNLLLHRHLFAIKADEYKKKKEKIQKWMDADKEKQDFYDNAVEPKDIKCPNCKTIMKCTYRLLEDYTDNPMRVCFLFDCSACNKRQGVYENGETSVSKPKLCPKCSKEVKVTSKYKDDVFTWKTKCISCNYKETTVDDYRESRLERKKEEEKDKALLEKHREEFCLSDEEGKEYVETIEALEVAGEVYEEEANKYDNPVYAKASQIKKTPIVELENILTSAIQDAKYNKLSFEKPEIGQYVIVPFTLQDTNSTRKERNSTSELEKIINEILKDTNWRLMSNSISYRLGYLEGRLKGYEREEDILKLAGKKDQPEPKSKVDPEKRAKYASNNFVQMARLTGKYEGVERMRKRRLEKEPEGFFLDANDEGYQCGICGDYYSGDKTWWNLDGVRCADCWRNIKEDAIPSLSHRFHNEKEWIADWQLKSNHKVQWSTAQKLKRQGILIGRDLKRKDGKVYTTVYLISENQEFLEKYPRQDFKIESTISDGNGGQIKL